MSTPPLALSPPGPSLRDTPARQLRLNQQRLLFEKARENLEFLLEQTPPRSSPVRRMSQGEGPGGNNHPPPPPAQKDPLEFNTLTVTSRLVTWANDPRNAKTVKTRDREEIEFLQRMQKYETAFSEEDRRAYRRRLHLYFIVSDI